MSNVNKLLNFQSGVLPIFKKSLHQESTGWISEVVNNIAIPLTFFLAFGLGLQDYIRDVDGMSYIQFISPGLITMTFLLEAYRKGAWGMWLDKWHQKVLNEYRIKPVNATDIIIGEILGGFTIAILKGAIVTAVLLMIAPVSIPLQNFFLYLMLLFPGAVLFTSIGFIVGTSFSKPDQIAKSQTVFITPLLYLGGLFFPISALPDDLQPFIHWLPTTAFFDGGRNALIFGELDPHYVMVACVSGLLGFLLATFWFDYKLSQ